MVRVLSLHRQGLRRLARASGSSGRRRRRAGGASPAHGPPRASRATASTPPNRFAKKIADPRHIPTSPTPSSSASATSPSWPVFSSWRFTSFLAVLEYYLITAVVGILMPFGLLQSTKFLAGKGHRRRRRLGHQAHGHELHPRLHRTGAQKQHDVFRAATFRSTNCSRMFLTVCAPDAAHLEGAASGLEPDGRLAQPRGRRCGPHLPRRAAGVVAGRRRPGAWATSRPRAASSSGKRVVDFERRSTRRGPPCPLPPGDSGPAPGASASSAAASPSSEPAAASPSLGAPGAGRTLVMSSHQPPNPSAAPPQLAAKSTVAMPTAAMPATPKPKPS